MGRLRAGALVVVVSLLAPLVAAPGPASALPPASWDLDPSTDRPHDFNSYDPNGANAGWQSNPTAYVHWAFWPACTGTTMHDGVAYSSGRSRYCTKSVEARTIGTTDWKSLTPKAERPEPAALTWSTDWTKSNGSTGLGGAIGPSARQVGGVLLVDLWTGSRDGDPTVEYRVVMNVGTLDLTVMRSVGSNGRFEQAKNAGGDNILTVTSGPGARSVMIPATDVCTNPEARATSSFSAMWSVSLFDRKLHPKFASFDGAVLESDAYGTGDAFPVFDPNTGSFSVKACAPHYKADGSLNVGYYRLVLSRAMLERAGYFIADSRGRPVTDGRLLSQVELEAIGRKVARDFTFTSSAQKDAGAEITLLVADDGELSVSISAVVSYSAPTFTVSRVGPAVWQTADSAKSGGPVVVGYRTANKATGTLTVELRTRAGKLVAKSAKKVKSSDLGQASVNIPRSAKSGAYVLKVYVVGAKVKGRSKTTVIQNLPVAVAKSP